MIKILQKHHDYLESFKKAQEASKSAGLQHVGIDIFRQEPPATPNPQSVLARVSELVQEQYQRSGLPFDLACVNATAYGYVALRLIGYPCEIVIGDLIDGDGDGYFETCIDELLDERNQGVKGLNKTQNIHTWLQVSGEHIIDFTVSKYMASRHPHLLGSNPEAPFHLECLSDRRWGNQARYEPILIGCGLIKETNPQAIINLAEDMYDIHNLPVGKYTEDPMKFIFETAPLVQERQLKLTEAVDS